MRMGLSHGMYHDSSCNANDFKDLAISVHLTSSSSDCLILARYPF